MSHGIKEHISDMLTLHDETRDHQFDGDTVEDKMFALLWLTEQAGGTARSSLGLGTFQIFYL